MSAEQVREVKVTFLGDRRRMVEWSHDITADDMVVAADMIASNILPLVPDDNAEDD
jgi:hypothetical protein